VLLSDYFNYYSQEFLEKQRRRLNLQKKRRRRHRLYALLLALSALGLVFLPGLRGAGKRTDAQSRANSSNNRPVQYHTSQDTIAFARVAGTDLILYEPTGSDVIEGIGYHQAYNRKSLSLQPLGNYYQDADNTKAQVKAKLSKIHPVSFVMATRGRGSSPTSSVDISLAAGTVIKSPVDGYIADIVPYKLYGRYNDYRIEIIAKGYPRFKIAIVHVDNLTVTKGERVFKGSTKLASVRPLRFGSQINDYLTTPRDHIHIQINPITAKTQKVANKQ